MASRPEVLTSQDWYRVRRGEDEITWGKTHTVPDLPRVLLSRRAHQELAFLDAGQREAVRRCLGQLGCGAAGQQGAAVANGGPRRLVRVGELRIVHQAEPDTGRIEVSTIRGGAVLDPENVGPAPTPRT